MRLQPGQRAPLFTMQDISGGIVNLGDLKGKKVLLSMFRYASCPFCNLRLFELSQHYKEWQNRGLVMIGVFESPSESISKYLGESKPPFPIIPDPELKLHRLYCAESSWLRFLLSAPLLLRPILKGFLPGRMEGDKAILPADFLIDRRGVISTAFYGGHLGDHINISKIESFLEES
ncbi:MAG: peroxiredoxin family protein [Fidelibacterota bacterium]